MPDHNLREAIADALVVNVIPEFVIDPASIGPITDEVLAVLSSHPEAVLSLLGTVRKGWLVNVTGRRVFHENFPAATVDFEAPTDRYLDEYQPVFVVSLAETAKDPE